MNKLFYLLVYLIFFSNAYSESYVKAGDSLIWDSDNKNYIANGDVVFKNERLKLIEEYFEDNLKTIREWQFEKIDKNNLLEYLGPPKYNRIAKENINLVGVTNGLAWTQVGGELLNIEVVKVPGKGRFSSTGKLGDVMKESIKAAEFYIKSNHLKLGIEQNIINSFDVHVQFLRVLHPKMDLQQGLL